MPIFSNQIERLQPQRGGVALVIEQHLDHRNKIWRNDYFMDLRIQPLYAVWSAKQRVVEDANHSVHVALREVTSARRIGDQVALDKAHANEATARADAATAVTDAEASYDELITFALTSALFTMTDRDLTEGLKETELREIERHCTNGGNPDGFTRKDVTADDMGRHILLRFIGLSPRNDQRLLCSLAPWVADRILIRIRSLLEVGNSRATQIRDRAIELRENVCPAIDTDNAKVDA